MVRWGTEGGTEGGAAVIYKGEIAFWYLCEWFYKSCLFFVCFLAYGRICTFSIEHMQCFINET